MRTTLLVITMLVFIIGCVSRKPERPQPISITEIHKGLYGSWGQDGYTLIDDMEDWQVSWNKLHGTYSPVPALPEIDLAENSVLIYRLGTRSSGGYGVAISSIVDQGDSLLVSVLEKQPGEGCMTTMAISSPFVIVSFPKKEKRSIRISLKAKQEPCR